MEENNAFLEFIYHEDLFILNEPEKAQDTEDEDPVDLNFLPESSTPSIVKESEPVTFFGHNKKNILVLIHEPDSPWPAQHELEFLMKIIESGLKYSKNDFALANTAKFPKEQVLKEIPHKFLIAFGESIGHTGDNISLYEVRETAGKKELLAENLSIIARDESRKRQLWKALKTMFDL